MCTVVILQGLSPEIPLAIACNRDEFFARPTRPFHRWSAVGNEVAAGLDERSGGTWFGVGKTFVAALTNDRRNGTPFAKTRTRGELVAQALRASSWETWETWQAAQRADAFGDCFLFVSDGWESRVYANQQGRWSTSFLSPGLHVLGNFGLNQESDASYRALRAATADWDWQDEGAVLQHRLRDLVATHGDDGVCVHGAEYGTRSSAIYLHASSSVPAGRRIWISDDAPCRGDWYEASDMLPG